MNMLTLEKTGDMAKALADCKVGEPKTLTLEVVPVMDDDTTFVAKVNSVEYAEPSGEEPTEEKPAPKEKPYKPGKKMGGMQEMEM